MGPYCKFCGQRCFMHLPMYTPEHIVKAYGTSTIIATCAGGQAFEKEKVGYCYEDIQRFEPLGAAQRIAFGDDERTPAAQRVNCNEEDAERWDGLA